MTFISKSVILNGKIASELIYKPCPSTEFSTSLTKISIASLTLKTSATINERCFLSCNFVKSQRYTKNGGIEYYNLPLVSFIANLNDKNSLRNFQFPTSWFAINTLSDVLTFTITSNIGNKVVQDCDVTILVYFA